MTMRFLYCPECVAVVSRAALTFSEKAEDKLHNWPTFGEETPLMALNIIVHP